MSGVLVSGAAVCVSTADYEYYVWPCIPCAQRVPPAAAAMPVQRAVLSTTIAKQLCSLSVSADDLVTAVGAKGALRAALNMSNVLRSA